MKNKNWHEHYEVEFHSHSTRAVINPSAHDYTVEQIEDQTHHARIFASQTQTSIIELPSETLERFEAEFADKQQREVLRKRHPEVAEAYEKYILTLWFAGYKNNFDQK